MGQHEFARRTVLKAGGAVGLVGLTTVAGPSRAFAAGPGPEVVLPWLDQPDPIPPGAVDIVANLLVWESLNSWRTPSDKFFTVKHYNQPALSADTWTLNINGLVDHPHALNLAELKRRPQDE